MLKRNRELEREVIKNLQNDDKVSNISKKDNISTDEEMKQLEECIKLSKIESERKEKESEQEYVQYLEDLE